jgi:hypothetical protein
MDKIKDKFEIFNYSKQLFAYLRLFLIRKLHLQRRTQIQSVDLLRIHHILEG